MRYKSQFEKDVIEGLSQKNKRLFSKYFYDVKGDKIFQEIMDLEEYYLTESEAEIIKTRTKDIAAIFPYDRYDIIELGAGDGTKTVYFLKQLFELHKEISYYPLDISPDVLQTNVGNIKTVLPDLDVHPIPGDYFNTLKSLENKTPKMLMFMGSNIGNYINERAVDFLRMISHYMKSGDMLLVGIDLKKNPLKILRAYDDSKCVTKRFNLNLLERINRELKGNIKLSDFDHYPYYDPITGIAHSYLVSLTDQYAQIGDHRIHFEKNELIHMEVSQKYSLDEIEQLKAKSGFRGVTHFLDSKEYFSVSAFEK